MRSLLKPLVFGLLLSLALMFAVQWSVVHAALDAVIEDYVGNELVQDADELFGGLALTPDGEVYLAVVHFDPVYLSPSSGRYFQIFSDGASILASPSLGQASLRVPMLAPGQHDVRPHPGPLEQALLLSASGYELEGKRVTIAIAANMKPIQASFDRVMMHYARVSLLMFALLVALQIGIVRWALAPLRRVQADVGRLERGEISQLGERVPDEVLPLVREVNRLLDLLGKRLQRSRESLGNLAHALKGPLAMLVHIAHDDALQPHTELRRQMGEQLDLLNRRIDSELRRARVAGGRAQGAQLDLGPELDALVQTMRKLYRDRRLEIDCQVAPGLQFQGDREDLLELCGNLLDNACKWAHARVRLSARAEQGWVLTVADDGPGCSAEGLRQIAQRGARLDEAIAGHGLGLAIASGIASSYGASLQFGRSAELGGFEASVHFANR